MVIVDPSNPTHRNGFFMTKGQSRRHNKNSGKYAAAFAKTIKNKIRKIVKLMKTHPNNKQLSVKLAYLKTADGRIKRKSKKQSKKYA
jgi:hypothetical protein